MIDTLELVPVKQLPVLYEEMFKGDGVRCMCVCMEMVKRKLPRKISNKHNVLYKRLKKTYYDVASPESFGGLRQIKPPKTSSKKIQR